MNGVYSKIDARSIPLFGVRANRVSKFYVQENIEVIQLDSKNFEKRNSLFWFSFEWTICWLLAQYIEFKSSKVVLEYLKQSEMFVENNGQDKTQLLTNARQAFGSKRIVKLFKLWTRGFNYSSSLMQHFCKHVAQAEALDDVYNVSGSFSWNGQRIYPESAQPDFWAKFYLNCPNGQAVRNRYRQVAQLYEQSGGGRTLSIACGSAQPLIHAMYELKMQGKNRETELVLTDTSESSLGIAKRRADQAGVNGQISCHKVSFLMLKKVFANEKFDVVEACGILDYLSDRYVISLLKFALNSLNKNGKVIVSNMNETRGANLLQKMYNWAIHYRTSEELGWLIKKAGGQNIKVYVEPWGIHSVATANLRLST